MIAALPLATVEDGAFTGDGITTITTTITTTTRFGAFKPTPTYISPPDYASALHMEPSDGSYPFTFINKDTMYDVPFHPDRNTMRNVACESIHTSESQSMQRLHESTAIDAHHHLSQDIHDQASTARVSGRHMQLQREQPDNNELETQNDEEGSSA